MEIAQTPQSGWLDALRAHARSHMPAALGLGLSALAVVVLLGQSLLQIATGEASAVLRFALIGGAAGFAATALGAAPALFLRGIPQRVEDSMLGMAAGMMLAASAMIFVVSHEVIPETHRNGHQTPATVGLMAGFAVMMVLDAMLG